MSYFHLNIKILCKFLPPESVLFRQHKSEVKTRKTLKRKHIERRINKTFESMRGPQCGGGKFGGKMKAVDVLLKRLTKWES